MAAVRPLTSSSSGAARRSSRPRTRCSRAAGTPPRESPAQTLDEFRDQLRHIGERLFALLDTDPGLGSVVLLEATSIDEEMTQRVLGLLDTFGALGAAFLQNGVSKGFLRADLDTASVGRALTSLTLPSLFAAIRGEAGPEERTRYVEAMIGLVCDGIGAPPARAG